jgi:hypothetical protein
MSAPPSLLQPPHPLPTSGTSKIPGKTSRHHS